MTGITNPAGTVTYGYNAAGEQTSMVQPEGTVATGYDVNGFVDSVTDWRGDTFTMVNDADGRMLTAARSNGVDTSYSYDAAGRLTSVGHTGPNGGIDGFSYMLDPNGNRTAVVSNAGTETYTLDALNRLTNASYPGGLSEAFAYDAAGNRTSHAKTDGSTVGFTVDATGQLISDTSGSTYAYDAAGNLTSTSDGESYTYDDYGRHTSISAGGVTQTYGYDAQDVRVTVDGQTQLWDRNGGLPTLISTSGGDNYVHTAGIARDGNDWLLADAVGSVRTVVDNTGAATGTQSFTAFGEQLTGSGTFGFAGEQQDPTGLQHLRARQYNPALGRFTTVDPIQPGAPGTTGYNLYAYSGNNPTTWTDPSGQAVLAEYGALAKRGALYGASLSAALTPWTCDQADNAWYEPSTNIDASCVLTEIALGAIFGAIGGPGAGKGASINRLVSVACGWGAVEGGTGAAAHARVQGEQTSVASVGLSAAFGCITAGLLAGRINAWRNHSATPQAPSPAVSRNASMDSFTATGSTIHHSPTATAIGDDVATDINFNRSQGAAGHDVIVHGMIRDGEAFFVVDGLPTNTQQIAAAILENPDYVPGTPIQLASCFAGCPVNGGASLADELSEALGGVTVTSSTSRVQIDPVTGLLLESGS